YCEGPQGLKPHFFWGAPFGWPEGHPPRTESPGLTQDRAKTGGSRTGSLRPVETPPFRSVSEFASGARALREPVLALMQGHGLFRARYDAAGFGGATIL